MTIKAAEVIFVGAMDEENSGIGKPVPAHVKLRFLDAEGRRNTLLLGLSDYQVVAISRIPDQR